MSSITEVSASQKSAYQRPYKTRGQRREIARRKHDENTDQKFLVRVAVAAGLLLLLAVGIAVRSWADRDTEVAATVESPR
ncbi:hypothetical protein [Hymenobacter sp. UYCo722]|uniref:hypothetical protein n=1 Tax=Hymenobacter sp. UYCo722 TaxID=3156335 RepID=UPI003394C903